MWEYVRRIRKIKRKKSKIKITPKIKRRMQIMIDKYIENMSENSNLKERALRELSEWFGGMEMFIPEIPEKVKKKGILPPEAYFWIGVLRGLGIKRILIPPRRDIRASKKFFEKVYSTLWNIISTTPSPRGRNRGWYNLLKEKGYVEEWMKETGKNEEEMRQIIAFFAIRIKSLISYHRRKKKKK